MNIVIIGSGNVAAVFGRKLIKAGHAVIQIYSRNAKAASELAYEWDTESTNYTSLINKTADAYIIAVPDDAIKTIAADLRLTGRVVVHTAASVHMEVLSDITENYGVLYPLQSLNKEQEVLPDISVYTEAANERTAKVLYQLAAAIGQAPVHAADFDKRGRLHVAAVFVNNFTNHLFTLAAGFCKAEGISFSELLPLILNTTSRLQEQPPAEMQTGPAIREDMVTIEKHRELLQKYPSLLEMYDFFTNSIRRG